MEYVDHFVDEFDMRVDAVTESVCKTMNELDETRIISLLGLSQALTRLAKDEPREELEFLFNSCKEMCLALRGDE